MNLFGQWTGNAILGLLIDAVLDTAGVLTEIAKTNISLSISCLQLVAAVAGALLVNLAGRKRLLIITNGSLALIWLALAVATAVHNSTASLAAARTMLAMIFLFNIVFATGMTPLQVLYPVEVLSYEMRAKGLAFTGLFNNIATLVNQFLWPITLPKLGWKTYIITMLWCLFQAMIVYLFFPETRGRTVGFLTPCLPTDARLITICIIVGTTR